MNDYFSISKPLRHLRNLMGRAIRKKTNDHQGLILNKTILRRSHSEFNLILRQTTIELKNMRIQRSLSDCTIPHSVDISLPNNDTQNQEATDITITPTSPTIAPISSPASSPILSFSTRSCCNIHNKTNWPRPEVESFILAIENNDNDQFTLTEELEELSESQSSKFTL